ncbi:MAG TPA: hypothetical protein VE604_14185 [Candidatus Polarisedimenticolia bacterium]|nr:hypothetical protein [Candidatus Polarisedimenticolia bacterium]
MPKNERNQNGRSNVRVLHFPATSPTLTGTDGTTDALADSIRKAWTQKSSTTKPSSTTNPGLLRLADGEF